MDSNSCCICLEPQLGFCASVRPWLCNHWCHEECIIKYIACMINSQRDRDRLIEGPRCIVCHFPFDSGTRNDNLFCEARDRPIPRAPPVSERVAVPPPKPPHDVLPLCCGRLVATHNNGSDPYVVRLQDRRMHYWPEFQPAFGSYMATWVCYTCNRTETLKSLNHAYKYVFPRPFCEDHRREATAVIDSETRSVQWVCCEPSFPAGELEMVHEIGGCIVQIVDSGSDYTDSE